VLPLKKTHETITAIATGAVPVALGMVLALVDRLGYELAEWVLWLGAGVAGILLVICFATTLHLTSKWRSTRAAVTALPISITALGTPAFAKYSGLKTTMHDGSSSEYGDRSTIPPGTETRADHSDSCSCPRIRIRVPEFAGPGRGLPHRLRAAEGAPLTAALRLRADAAA